MAELKRSADELREWEEVIRLALELQRRHQVASDRGRYNAHYKNAFAREPNCVNLASTQDLVTLKNDNHNDELWEWVSR